MEVKPGYKRTEVGVIPEEWDAIPLSSVLRKGRLGGNYANQDAEAELPLMKMGNLGRGYFDLSKVQFITPGVRPELVHRLVYGDVLFNTRNTLDLVGKVAIWRDELPVAYYNSNLMRLEFDSEQVCSNEYANYFLNTEGSVSRLRALATGTTSVAAIYTRDLLKLQVLVPPKSEQRAIAEALSDVDGLLVGLDRLISKKRDLKQAAMQQLLTGQTRLPGFHGEWGVVYLKSIYANVFKKSPLSSADGGTLGAYPLFVSGGQAKRTDLALFQNTEALIISDGGVFDVKYFSGDFSVTDHCFVISLKGDMRFYFQWMSLGKAELDLMTFKGSGLRNLDKPTLGKVEVPLPSVTEQTAIAEVLAEMDAELAALEQRREKTRALKQGMMQELLTGRTRLV